MSESVAENDFHQKKNFHDVLFCKVRLSKMASTKTNKIKKQTPLFDLYNFAAFGSEKILQL